MNDPENIEDDFDFLERIKEKYTDLIPPPREETIVPEWLLDDCPQLAPPFTWFGGKRKLADMVWKVFGSGIPNYIEPFAGGLAVLLARPAEDFRKSKKILETFNDQNLLLLNFWRAVQFGNIEELVKSAVFPQHETELLLRRQFFIDKLPKLKDYLTGNDLPDDDPGKYRRFDMEVAGLWLYVTRNWIGAGADDPDKMPMEKIPVKGESGWLGGSPEKHLTCLQKRLKGATGFVGDWRRVVKSNTQTTGRGITGVFLDPPYRGSENYYAGVNDDLPERGIIADEVDQWALDKEQGHPDFRIAVCGYEHNFNIVEYEKRGWYLHRWKPSIGHRSANSSIEKRKDVTEITAFSPQCKENILKAKLPIYSIDG